ncbi:MAG: type I polyketide synthase, partial [Solirubrobacteraceae bacterium]
MTNSADNAVAIVGLGAIMPDAPNAATFWDNVTTGRYSISEVDPARWDPALYYDSDPQQPEKTYSKIGGWVRDWEWNPLDWKLPIPPKVSDAMDDAHKWAVACTRMALADAGWPDRPLNQDRTAVIIGNALSGEHHYLTALRIAFPELARELRDAASFAALPSDVRTAIESELHSNMDDWLPEVTEDTMPGELSNCAAGRIANLFNFHGPNYTVDAACASALAAMDASVEGLINHEFDVAITGGVDRNMSAAVYVKFCAIGALSGTGTRPYADGADGFVMGEGAALFIVKRLADAVRDENNIYAVVRGVGSASDGKGKGITAPNPVGQRLAVQRAWENAGLSPAECGLIEGHGTSTRVGDVAELASLTEAFSGAHLAPGSVALGSVKSNIGHLKAAAGAAGMLKATLALREKLLPASINFERPNPNVDWGTSPFAVNTELRDWEVAPGGTRVAGVSAFGFGGTNFHVVLEEHVPGQLEGNGRTSVSVPASTSAASAEPKLGGASAHEAKAPLRGALVLGTSDRSGLSTRLRGVAEAAGRGEAPPRRAPDEADLRAPERIALDYGDAAELGQKAELALRALDGDSPAAWSALAARGIFRGSGPPGKVAFMYTGQGSQYPNMLGELRRREPIVAQAFEAADAVMAPLLGDRALSELIFVDTDDPEAVAQADAELRRTEITQPAVLTADLALTELLGAYGITPDFVIGHSLGEYGALVAAGVMSFDDALVAVSARGSEMASLRVGDPGAMAAVSASLAEVEEVLAEVDGYVVVANVNSSSQLVLGGATSAVQDAMAKLGQRGREAVQLPVSHAFHTKIVAAVAEPLRAALRRLRLASPQIPVVANIDGSFYPMGPGSEEQIIDLLGRQVASPVQFVTGLQTLHDAGARLFVEVGPKRALWGFAADVLGEDAVSLYTNHPKLGDLTSFNHALCGLYAAGLGIGRAQPSGPALSAAAKPRPAADDTKPPAPDTKPATDDDTYRELGRMLAGVIERGRALLGEGDDTASEPVVITGAALGLPGVPQMFDDANVARILHGQQLIDVIPSHLRHEILDHHITRLVKGEDGGAAFEAIDREGDVIKLAARAGALALADEFGVPADRVAALGRETQLAIGAGIDALRDAGIPLVLRYKTTTTGSQLPDRWVLPESLRDDTGIVFASAFAGGNDLTEELNSFWADRSRHEQLDRLREIHARLSENGAGIENDAGIGLAEVQRHIHELELEVTEQPYQFDRRFLFRVLSMGHSQFAELICARGPNTQINSACASTTQAFALAEDWIRAGRCRRVIVIAADDVTSEHLLPWIGSGFLASGAAATDDVVEEAALPFDRRRHGMLLGMGAAALVVESASAARERGITPICEVLATATANSAFHGTRLDVDHIGQVMEGVVSQAERRGVRREEIAGETIFVSHETYTPARGGSAAAEIHALRQVFGERADQVVIANTKGLTGHPMGVGIEDVVAIKALET